MKSIIVYEDNHILVANKPRGMLSQADASGAQDMLTLIKMYLKEKYDKPGNVYLGLLHRLDRPVFGLMVFAKTSKAAARMSAAIRERRMKKEYLAVVSGSPQGGILEDYLRKDNEKNIVSVVKEGEPGGRFARLSYKVLEQKNGLSLVRVALETGRSHQIRVQFASRGMPIYGDVKYGHGQKDGLALASCLLKFEHPVLKEQMRFTFYPKEGVFSKFEDVLFT